MYIKTCMYIFKKKKCVYIFHIFIYDIIYLNINVNLQHENLTHENACKHFRNICFMCVSLDIHNKYTQYIHIYVNKHFLFSMRNRF